MGLNKQLYLFKSLILRVISAICSIFEVPSSVTIVQHWCCNICNFFLWRFRQRSRPKSVLSQKQKNFRATNFRVVNITHLNKLLLFFSFIPASNKWKKKIAFFSQGIKKLNKAIFLLKQELFPKKKKGLCSSKPAAATTYLFRKILRDNTRNISTNRLRLSWFLFCFCFFIKCNELLSFTFEIACKFQSFQTLASLLRVI